MGGQESLLANLNDPDAVSATAIVYGFGFDKLQNSTAGKAERPRAGYQRFRRRWSGADGTQLFNQYEISQSRMRTPYLPSR